MIKKTKKAFGKELPKEVSFEDIDEVAEWIIKEIILPQTEKKQ